MKRIYTILLNFFVTGLTIPLIFCTQSAMAEVQARLSRDTTSIDQPVRLQLQVMGQNDASPDLSVLYEDFEIIGRSTQQSVSVVNGQMSRTQGLTLTLMPKRTGTLVIPSIPVGKESTQPLKLEVLSGMSRGGSPAYIPPEPIVVAPSIAPQPNQASPIDLESEKRENGFPYWLVWLLGIGWLATMIAWWSSRRRKRSPKPIVQHEIGPENVKGQPRDELAEAIDALETAYRRTDREAARKAWLRWARHHWPEQPPSNLNRLAERCDQNIAQAVRLLDRAFYSPNNPDDWRQFNPQKLLEADKEEKTGTA